MRAVVWHGRGDVRVDTVPDPGIEQATDAIVRITSSGLCGSDLHLYTVMAPFMTVGDIVGHEPMGIVEAVGSAVGNLVVGDRVVVPFNIACGTCHMCAHGLQSQCETTEVRQQETGAALFGYTKLYGQVPGAQAELLRVPHADYGPIVVPQGPPDDRFLFLSDVLPTSWQALDYAAVKPGQSLVVLGLGPIGEMCARIALHRGVGPVVGVDLVSERLERARRHGVDVIDLTDISDTVDLADAVRTMTEGRGAHAVIDAVGMEAHGSPAVQLAHRLTALLPRRMARWAMRRVGVDRLAALHAAVEVVRRGGTISVIGVYGGMTDPMPMMKLFDKQITLRMGQANVRHWVGEIMPLLTDADPLGVESFATHHLPLEQAPSAYADFQAKRNGMIKVVFRPEQH